MTKIKNNNVIPPASERQKYKRPYLALTAATSHAFWREYSEWQVK